MDKYNNQLWEAEISSTLDDNIRYKIKGYWIFCLIQGNALSMTPTIGDDEHDNREGMIYCIATVREIHPAICKMETVPSTNSP